MKIGSYRYAFLLCAALFLGVSGCRSLFYTSPKLSPDEAATLVMPDRTVVVVRIDGKDVVGPRRQTEDGYPFILLKPGEHSVQILYEKDYLLYSKYCHVTFTITGLPGKQYNCRGVKIDKKLVCFWIEDIETGEVIAGRRPTTTDQNPSGHERSHILNDGLAGSASLLVAARRRGGLQIDDVRFGVCDCAWGVCRRAGTAVAYSREAGEETKAETG